MTIGTCEICGSAVPLLAVACPHCGTTQTLHAIGIASAVGVLAVAVLAGGFALSLHMSRKIDLGAPADAPPAGAASDAPPAVASSGDDFAWLSAGMESCESEAR